MQCTKFGQLIVRKIIKIVASRKGKEGGGRGKGEGKGGKGRERV